MIRRLLSRAAARYYFRKPEMADLIEVRLQSWRSIIASALNLAAFQLRRETVFRLTSVTLEVTNHCNLNCVMCPVNRSMSRDKGYMDFGLVKKIVDENPGLEYIALYTWGEPFLHPDLFRMIDYIGQAGIRTNTVTNGTLLDDACIDRLVKSPLDRIAVSVDGTGEFYERIRTFRYDTLEANIHRLVARRDQTGSPLKIDLIMTVFEQNEENVEEFCRAWQDKVDRIQIQPRLYTAEDGAAEVKKRTKLCDEPWRGSLFVHWDGTVAPCCVDYNNALVVGNAWEEELRVILNGPRMRCLRRDLLLGRFTGLCARCTEYPTPIVNPRFSQAPGSS